MVVGRLLSYWEGNFSGAILNFGRAQPHMEGNFWASTTERDFWKRLGGFGITVNVPGMYAFTQRNICYLATLISFLLTSVLTNCIANNHQWKLILSDLSLSIRKKNHLEKNTCLLDPHCCHIKILSLPWRRNCSVLMPNALAASSGLRAEKRLKTCNLREPQYIPVSHTPGTPKKNTKLNERNSFIKCWFCVWGTFRGSVGTSLETNHCHVDIIFDLSMYPPWN